MANYTPHDLALTPVMIPPVMLKLTWTLHLLAHRDHALWRVEAHAGPNDDLVGLGLYPCPGPQSWLTLKSYAADSVIRSISAASEYLAPPQPEPFPVPRNGGAPAA